VALACLRALAEESGDPARGVAAPSANRFGRVSPTRASDVLDELGDHLDPARDLVVDGGPCRIGVESTIVDCTAVPPRVLRLGAISQQQVDEVLAGPGPEEGSTGSAGVAASPASPVGDRAIAQAAVSPGTPAPVRAPGTLEAHYSPHARVVLVERSAAGTQIAELAGAGEPPHRDADDAHDPRRLLTLEGQQPAPITDLVRGGAVGLIAPADVSTPTGWARLSAPGSGEEYARDLYAALRKADELGLATVVAVLPDPAEGVLAQAVRDRLARAAHGD
jgi:L-threonylcarbamoyladenylate synthase